MNLAFPNAEGNVFFGSEELIENGLEASRKSPRKRMIFPMHRSQEALVQRMLNFLQPGTYIRPHLHPRAHASESIFMMQGAIRFFTFDDNGKAISDDILRAHTSNSFVDIEPNVWHAFLVLEPDTILFECKMGPYDAQLDKVFAPWSPAEGDEEVASYLEKLNNLHFP